MKLLDKDIELAIFDLDGTLINSTSLWKDVDETFFKRRNMVVGEEYSKEIAHVGLEKAAKITKEKYLPNEKEEDILKEWNDLAIEAYKFRITLKDNVIKLFELLKKNNVKIALATANSKELYEPCLNRLQIAKYFDAIEDVNSCLEGKNSSEIYDKITHKFLVNKDNVVIFEDMITALKTSFNAGYLTVGINDKISVINESENRKYCHLFIDDFKEIIALIK